MYIYIYIYITRGKFGGYCLTHNNISILKEVINLCIPYILNPWFKNLNSDFTLNNCLFGSADLILNAEQDKYKYSGYMMAFYSESDFSFTDGSVGILKIKVCTLNKSLHTG